MRIASVERTLVRAPFKEEILWGSGRRTATTRLVVKIVTEDGTVGWGETIALIAPVLAVFDDVVAPLLEGYCVANAERFHRHVLGAGYYHHKRAAVMAIAAAEMAMWDALGKSAGLPLHALWGGLWREEVEAAAYLFTPDTDQLAARIARFRDEGYTTFKVKIGYDARTDLAVAEAARTAVGDAPLRLDVNGAWSPGLARRMVARLAPLEPQYIEQPLELDDLAGHALLRRSAATPIALDESAYTLSDVGNIVRAEAADVVLLDPHEAGGLWPTIKAAAVCEAVGLPVTLHSGGELALSQAAYVHLAASIPNMAIAIDTERTYLGRDIGTGPELAGGRFRVPQGPGLGVTVDEAAVADLATDRITGAYLDPARPGWFPMKPDFDV